MRLYYTGASPNNIRKARQHAPSHTHGYGWTPAKMTPHDGPYFLDNGAYTGDFDGDEWVDAIERTLLDMPTRPDFIVLPDVYGDAEATLEKHRKWLYEKPLPLRSGELERYMVLQPGIPVEDQLEEHQNVVDVRLGVQGVFLGGPKRWKRAVGQQVVDLAQKHDLRTHVGNPGGKDGLVWAYRCGFDSCDTTSIFQNQYWHYLDALEEATTETDQDYGTSSSDTDTTQTTLF